jgi:sigma-54-specific transcriptional regulator
MTEPSLATNTPAFVATTWVFADPVSQRLLRKLERVAPSDASVLVTGESGAGKAAVARCLHARSDRPNGAFVTVSCGAVTTSASQWFEAAQGGTLLLDEVADLPPASQLELLRALQERELAGLGARRPRERQARVVAATSEDLTAAVEAARFRRDLYYRLGVVRLAVAPLRHRPGDILPLAQAFLDRYARRAEGRSIRLGERATRALLDHAWPGNVRELENVIRAAALVCRADELAVSDLQLGNGPTLYGEAGAFEDLRRLLLGLYRAEPDRLAERVEELLIRSAHEHCGGNQVQTARLLGISRNVVRTRLRRIGLLGRGE